MNVGLHDKVWYYEDMQRIVQGPFSPEEMNSWYKSGYFADEL